MGFFRRLVHVFSPSARVRAAVAEAKAGRGAPVVPVHDAASGSDLVAAFNYGVCLAEGVGGERDQPAVAHWLRRAADGVVNAQYWYERMLCEGNGVDLPAGRAWIQRASDSGMIEA